MDLKENKVDSRKLIDALYELSRENFNVSDDTILDKIYVHLEKIADGNDFLGLFRDFAVWLESVLKRWTSTTIFGGVKVLSIRLLGLVGSTPHGFTTVKHMLPELEKLMSNLEVRNDSSLMVPLINNLSLFLNHEEGFNWVLNSEVWKHAINSFYGDHSIYTNRSAVKFISLLLNKLDKRSHTIVEILNVVCEPLVHNCLLRINPLPKLEKIGVPPVNKDSKCIVSEQKKTTQLESQSRAAKYICDILDEIVSSKSYLPVELEPQIPNDVISACSGSPKDVQLLHQMVVMMMLNNTCSLNKLAEGGEMDHLRADGLTGDSQCPLEPAYLGALQALQSFMSLGHVSSVLDFCVFCLSRIARFRETAVLKFHLHLKCNKCEEMETILVNQLGMFLDLHCTVCNSSLLRNTIREISDFSSGDTTVVRIDTESLYAHLDRNIVKKFKDLISDKTMSTLYLQLGICSCDRVVNLLFFMTSKFGMISFVVKSLKWGIIHNCCHESERMNLILVNLISLASRLVVERKIKIYIFKDLFDSIKCILEMEKNTRVVVCTLQFLNKLLISQLIAEFNIWSGLKQPYLLFKTSLQCIAVLLAKNLKNHSSWEVRDTTLEVFTEWVTEPRNIILDITTASFIELKLYGLVSTLAAHDSSAYVRSSALKFLAKVVRTKLCLHEISSKELSDLAVKTLMSDEMPEPRMAACDLLAAMYVTDFLPEEGMPGNLYEAVYTASLKELDWEVKKAMLRFWQCVITKELMNNKVPLLGQFNLRSHDNTEEVVVKVIRVMGKLNDIGCFKVIWSDVMDDSDISVSQEASLVVENLLDLDRKWNFINRIVEECCMEVDERDCTCKSLNLKEFFINISQNEWRQKLEARKNWIENTCDDLNSLLDHILNPDSSTDWDHNAIDCY